MTGVAIFAGVLGALQLDRYLDRNDLATFSLQTPSASSQIRPVALEANAAPFDFRAASKKVSPSVVSVDRFQRVSRGFFNEPGAVAATGQGSGVIVSSNGVIVTNNHVVAGAESVKVRLADKRTFNAKVLGTDPRSDLAVIKIDAPNLVPAELGTSDDIEVGEWVLAVGNPLGFDNTVSVGVVSSLKRNLPVGDQGLVGAIQTDAAINPGNSGGALTNSQGQLIGINSAIASSTGQSVGIGFAIPIDRVKTVVNDIVKLGYARYAGLGVRYNPELDNVIGRPDVRAEIAERTGASPESVPSAGVIVLDSSGAAQQAGIGQFDVILGIGDEKVEGTFDLNRALVPRKPGEQVTVKYWSKGQIKSTKLTLQEIRPI